MSARPSAFRHSPSKAHSSTQNSDSESVASDALTDSLPSFSSANFATSTPLKPSRATQRALDALPLQVHRDDLALLLHASDTESLAESDVSDERDSRFEGRADVSAGRARLGRRRLSEFTTVDAARSAIKSSQTLSSASINGSHTSRPHSETRSATSSASSRLSQHSTSRTETPRAFPSSSRAPAAAEVLRNGAPSPSAGSSTLVESVESTASSHSKGKARASDAGIGEVTLRAFGGNVSEEEAEEEDRTVHPASVARGRRSTTPPVEDEESSSPPRRRSRAQRPGQLSSYVQSHTPARTPRSQPPATAQTPAAPGAYPPTARKPRASHAFLVQTPNTPASALARSVDEGGSPADRVHDIFARVIHGPEGALTKSAERRAALLALQKGAASPARTPSRSAQAGEPKTPHPSGYYPFTPGSARGGVASRSPLPARTPRSAGRQVAWKEEDEEEETSPIKEPRPNKLEQTLRQISQVQRLTEGAQRAARPEAEGRESRWNIQPSPTRHSTREYEADRDGYPGEVGSDEESEDEDEDEGQARAVAERSAIAFAMAKSFGSAGSDELSAIEEQEPQEELQLSPPSAPRSPSPSLPALPPPVSHSPSPVKRHQPRFTPSKWGEPSRSFEKQSFPKVERSTEPTPPAAPAFLPTPTHSSPPRAKRASTSPATSPRRTLAASLASPSRQRQRTASNEEKKLQASVNSLVEDPLVALAASFTLAVRDLSAPRVDLNSIGLPLAPPASGLSDNLSRKKKESDARRRELELELSEIGLAGEKSRATRERALQELEGARTEEGQIGKRLEELMRAVEGLGSKVGTEVSAVVQDTIEGENRRRSQWLLLSLVVQFLVLWSIIRHANARAQSNFGSPYSAFLLPQDTHRYTLPSLLPDTVKVLGTDATVKSMLGGAKETIGNMTGQTGLEQSGAQQKTEGDAEYKAAQAQGYVEGTQDKIGGKIDQVTGTVTGDSAKELEGKARNESGNLQQELNKPSSV